MRPSLCALSALRLCVRGSFCVVGDESVDAHLLDLDIHKHLRECYCNGCHRATGPWAPANEIPKRMISKRPAEKISPKMRYESLKYNVHP